MDTSFGQHGIQVASVSCSVMSDSATPWTPPLAHQAPLSMEFSRQEYWGGFPFPSPGDLPDPGVKPWSPALQADSLPSESPGKCQHGIVLYARFPQGWAAVGKDDQVHFALSDHFQSLLCPSTYFFHLP